MKTLSAHTFLLGFVLLAFSLVAYAQNFTGFQNSSITSEPTLRCFQNGKQVIQETGQFLPSKDSGKNIYSFYDKQGGYSIILFDLGETTCTLTKLAK